MNMKTASSDTTARDLCLSIAANWHQVEQRLDSTLGALRGISFAEYRLLQALADAPEAQASRVDLARAVRLTPSGITRALRPLEKLGIVSTVKSKRDARLSLAKLTPAGMQVVEEASQIVSETMTSMLVRSQATLPTLQKLGKLLGDIAS